MSKEKELAERLDKEAMLIRGMGMAGIGGRRSKMMNEASSLLLSQENRIAELEKALAPFNLALSWLESRLGDDIYELDDETHMIGCEIRLADLRRARSALTPSSPGEEK